MLSNQFQVLIIQMFFFALAIFSPPLLLFLPAQGTVFDFFIFVDDEPFLDLEIH